MKITSVQTIIVRVPFTHGDAGSSGRAGNLRLSTINTLLVRVETETGLVGWGEAFGFNLVDATKAAIDTVITPLCIGQDVGTIVAVLERRLHNYGRNGPTSFGIAGIDIALWDIAGKAAGQPLHRLLGDGGRSQVPAYASLLRYGDAATVTRNVAETVARGYRAIKLHEIDPAIIRAARAATPPGMPLMVDVNCPWTPAEAIDIARAVVDCDLTWIEEPVWPPEDFPGMAQVRAARAVPIAAGENTTTIPDFAAMLAAGAVDYVQPSVTKMGLTNLQAVAQLARQHGVAVAPHSPYFGPGLLATIHFAAAAQAIVAVERYGCDLGADLFGGAATPVDGLFTVPTAPGLGIEPDAAVIAQFS
jgi:D-galactarolactone cycloisomerase